MNYRDTVARGAELLDHHRVPDWADGIDLSTLNLADGFQCILGQLFGSYSHGLDALFAGEALFTRFDASKEHGFDGDDYDRLTAEWENLIRDRRAAVKS